MNLTKLRELSSLSEKATQGEWGWWMSEKPPFDICIGEEVHAGSFQKASDAELACALVNWFRANESALMEMERNDRRYRWLAKSVYRTSDMEPAHWCIPETCGLGKTLEDALDAALDAGGKEGA